MNIVFFLNRAMTNTDKGENANKRGFTLVELLMTIAISGLIIAALFSFYWTQQDTAEAQRDVAIIQQDVRGAMEVLAKDIRMAGYDPLTKNNGAGFIAQSVGADAFFLYGGTTQCLPGGSSCSRADDITTDALRIAFSGDMNGDGEVKNIDANHPQEQIAYAYNTSGVCANIGCLQRFTPGGVGANVWQNMAEHIDGVEFLYHLRDGTSAIAPSPAELRDIRAVTVSILARSTYGKKGFTNNESYRPASCANVAVGSPCGLAATPTIQGKPIFNDGLPYNDNFHRNLLTFTVQCRNLK
jgi:type IV pilus assembly protein PilW